MNLDRFGNAVADFEPKGIPAGKTALLIPGIALGKFGTRLVHSALQSQLAKKMDARVASIEAAKYLRLLGPLVGIIACFLLGWRPVSGFLGSRLSDALKTGWLTGAIDKSFFKTEPLDLHIGLTERMSDKLVDVVTKIKTGMPPYYLGSGKPAASTGMPPYSLGSAPSVGAGVGLPQYAARLTEVQAPAEAAEDVALRKMA